MGMGLLRRIKKMDKEDIKNKIEQLEKELKELKNKMTDSTWEPYKNGYYIDGNGMCYEVEGLGYKYPAPHNCFRTKELAELRAKQREAENELFNIWEYLVGNWRPNNKDQSWHVVWNDYENVPISFADSQPGEISIYKLFPTSELAMKQYELASDHARAYVRGEF
jgi:hypothetical protein